jgi:hypothetical protein
MFWYESHMVLNPELHCPNCTNDFVAKEHEESLTMDENG